jgi:hypothetical protein
MAYSHLCVTTYIDAVLKSSISYLHPIHHETVINQAP